MSAAKRGETPELPERYEDIVQRLGALVDRLEKGDLSLEDSVSAFEQGIRLARAGEARLNEAEKRVELLLADDRTAPLDGAASGGSNSPPAASKTRKSRTEDGDIPF